MAGDQQQDDYLGRRPVSTPFGLFDCDVPVDGSIEFVISHVDSHGAARTLAVGMQAVGGSYGSGGWFHPRRVCSFAGRPVKRQVMRRPEVAVAAAGGGPIAGCLLLTC